MDLLLPDEGRILDTKCGFGLCAAYVMKDITTEPAFGRDFKRRLESAEHSTWARYSPSVLLVSERYGWVRLEHEAVTSFRTTRHRPAPVRRSAAF